MSPPFQVPDFTKRAILLSLCLAAAACDRQERTYEAPSRNVPKTIIPASFKVDDQTRFFGASPPGGASGSPLAWKVPAGWTQVAAQEFRDPNFKLDAVPDGEAYVSILSGAGGGLQANVDRWRRQFGMEPASAAELAALPKLPMMGRQASLVDLTGKFAGMAGPMAPAEAPRENWRLVGAILELPAVMITVKMTGPAAQIEGELAHFKEFAASLAMPMPGGAGTPPASEKNAEAPK